MSTVIRPSLTSAELNQWLQSIDARNEADPGPGHAGDDVLTAGQAAVDVINARRGKP